MDLRNKKVTVVGLGNSGINAAKLLAKLGAHVWATDNNDAPQIRAAVETFPKDSIRFELGKHTRRFVEGSSILVVSPGVEKKALPLRLAKRYKIPVMGEMEFGFRFCKGRIIAITGTNGKSTVTTLIGEMLKDSGLETVVCGNIGNSLSGEVGRITSKTWVVVEVSSFQLEGIEKFRPHIAIILNVTDDHVDRHGTFDKYFKEKLKIFKNQENADFLILNNDTENLRKAGRKARSNVLFFSRREKVNGAYIRDGDVFCCHCETKQGLSPQGTVPVLSKQSINTRLIDCFGPSAFAKASADKSGLAMTESEEKILSIRDILLKGDHNVENILASILACRIAGVSSESMRKTLKNFKGLTHRFETVSIVDGVEYIDDSKGTTVDSTVRALESCPRPVILIAGGRDKDSDFTIIRSVIRDKVKHVVLIGEARAKIKDAVGSIVETHAAKTLEDAVTLAQTLSSDGDIVLLSPMCASFDMFRSYKHRGEVFREAVRRLV